MKKGLRGRVTRKKPNLRQGNRQKLIISCNKKKTSRNGPLNNGKMYY